MNNLLLTESADESGAADAMVPKDLVFLRVSKNCLQNKKR